MIELFKLIKLPHSQKIRKIIKILEILEIECIAAGEDSSILTLPLSCDAFYIEGLCAHIVALYPADSAITAAVASYTAAVQAGDISAAEYRALFNALRHALYRQSGVQPSEWDLIAPGFRYGSTAPQTLSKIDAAVAGLPPETATVKVPDVLRPAERPFYAGIYVYAEDIRAPFNLGSIFRTAEAFGVEKVLLSAGCVSPEQPRAQRSSMGCTRFLPWEYLPLEALPPDIPVFALETGGAPITSFTFPRQGIVLLGSEELGLSAEALKRVSAGIVSIPMKGIKASLNVAVAFGILMQYWTASLKIQEG